MKRIMLGVGLMASLLVVGAVLLPEGEVVAIYALDVDGQAHSTHLWIVDLEGQQFMRAGSTSAAWLDRLRGQADLELIRGEGASAAPQPFRAVILEDQATVGAVNAAMAEKYGLSNSVVGLFADLDASVAVRLEARPGGGSPSSDPSTSPH